ncbi:MAG: sensor domain-containing diguanylate cyclase [Armatimonadetes bacterium]|nr:sensor domain-containing diguanylate cyclase [Armatimonadota bacterium]
MVRALAPIQDFPGRRGSMTRTKPSERRSSDAVPNGGAHPDELAAVLDAVAWSADRLTRSEDWTRDLAEIMGRLQAAIGATRVQLVERPSASEASNARRPAWVGRLARGHLVQRRLGRARAANNGGGPSTAILVPILVDGALWGHIAVEYAGSAPPWADAYADAMSLAAAAIAAAIRRRQVEDALRKSETRFHRLAENLHDVLFRYRIRPQAGFEFVSAAALEQTGYAAGEFLADPTLAAKVVHPEDRDTVAKAVVTAALANRALTMRCVRKDGRVVWLEHRMTPIRDERGRFVAVEGVARDVTEQRQLEERLFLDARHDPLTSLPNRALLYDRLVAQMALAKPGIGRGYAVLVLDVDRFKVVNDSLGHVSGDLVLREVGARIRAVVRPGDTVARLGGDEFAVLLSAVRGPEDAARIARRVHEALRAPLRIGSHEVLASLSIGIAIGAASYRFPEDAIRHADVAAYRAKSQGRGRTVVFDASMQAEADARVQLEVDLRSATANLDFAVFYQPIVASATAASSASKRCCGGGIRRAASSRR